MTTRSQGALEVVPESVEKIGIGECGHPGKDILPYKNFALNSLPFTKTNYKVEENEKITGGNGILA